MQASTEAFWTGLSQLQWYTLNTPWSSCTNTGWRVCKTEREQKLRGKKTQWEREERIKGEHMLYRIDGRVKLNSLITNKVTIVLSSLDSWPSLCKRCRREHIITSRVNGSTAVGQKTSSLRSCAVPTQHTKPVFNTPYDLIFLPP